MQIGVSDQSVGYAGPQTVDEDDFEVVNARRSKASPLSCTLSVRSCVGLRCNGSGGSERHTPSPYCRVIVEQDEGDRLAANPGMLARGGSHLGRGVRTQTFLLAQWCGLKCGDSRQWGRVLGRGHSFVRRSGSTRTRSRQVASSRSCHCKQTDKHIEAASGVLRVVADKGKARIWTRPSHLKALAHRAVRARGTPRLRCRTSRDR